MTVKQLIEYLQTQPPNLPVVYRCYSEYDSLETEDIQIMMLQPARPDGWVADNWDSKHTPSMCTVEYLVLPGN